VTLSSERGSWERICRNDSKRGTNKPWQAWKWERQNIYKNKCFE
jgi:hypothetical protein